MGIRMTTAEVLTFADTLDALIARYGQDVEEDTDRHGLLMTKAEDSPAFILFSPYHKWTTQALPCEIFLTFAAAKNLGEVLRAAVRDPEQTTRDKETQHE